MKRIFIAALALVLIVVLVACGSESATPSASPAGTQAASSLEYDATSTEGAEPIAAVANSPADLLKLLESAFNNRDAMALIGCFEPSAAFDLWGDMPVSELTVEQREEFLPFVSQVFSTSELMRYYDWWYDKDWSNTTPTAGLTVVNEQAYDDFADLTFTTVLSNAEGFEYSRHDSTLQMVCIEGEWFFSAVQTSWEMDSTSMYYQFFPPVYEGELFVAYRDGKYGFVDENDETIFPFVHDEVGEFSDGLCPVYNKAEGKWGYLDMRGRVITGYQYLAANKFADGYATVKAAHNNNWGVIDTYTLTSISFKYQDIGDYGEGLFAARLNGYWGFVTPDENNSGDPFVIIDFTYSEVEPKRFEHGRISVAINNAWGVIDAEGNYVVPLDRDSYEMTQSSRDFFKLGKNVYNSNGDLLREQAEIRYMDDQRDRCIVYDSYNQEWVHIMDVDGNTVIDLMQHTRDAVTDVQGTKGRIGIGAPYEKGDSEWSRVIINIDHIRANTYYNYVNLDGEFLFDNWVSGIYSNVASTNPVQIYTTDDYIIVSQTTEKWIEVWNKETREHQRLEGAAVRSIMGNFMLSRDHDLYDIRDLSKFGTYSSIIYIESGHMIVHDEAQIFYGIITDRGGVFSLSYPLEYTEIGYTNYGERNGNIVLEKGAEQSNYWIGPNGNFME